MKVLQPPRRLSALGRLRGEPPDMHQGLLVYALLGPKRSVRRVADLIRKPKSTVIARAKLFEWERRVRETPDPDVEAWGIYRAEYLQKRGGRRPLFAILKERVPLVGALARIDFTALEPDDEDDGTAPVEAPDDTPAAEPLPLPATPPIGRAETPDTPNLRPPEERVTEALAVPDAGEPKASPAAFFGESVDDPVELCDRALGYVMGKISAGQVKVRITDLTNLLRTRALLKGDPTERIAHTGLPGSELPETVRLRNISDPRERLRVMREDIAEIASILDAIAASEDQAPVNDGRVVDTEAVPDDPPRAAEGGA